jgi:O-antigen/teichoic acid export membrane protein
MEDLDAPDHVPGQELSMRDHFSNAAWGILDYAAYPIGMLAVAPVLLRNLGIAQYGVWTVASAAVSTGGIIASGFGDANIQHVARSRGKGDRSVLLGAVRSMMGINLALGILVGLAAWLLSPVAASHVAMQDLALRHDCIWSLRIASVLMLVRSVESVCISTHRAYERYGAAVRISILTRVLALGIGAVISFRIHNAVAIMASTAVLMIPGLWFQMTRLKQYLGMHSLLPKFDHDALRALLSFGAFSWLQAVSGVVFAQVDRLMIGVSLGAVAVASYSLCAQMTLPVFGFAASGLHFLFPYLSNRSAVMTGHSLARPILIALGWNAAFVLTASLVLTSFGPRILSVWAGQGILSAAEPVLALLIWSSALLGLNVTGTYALLALGRVRIVTWINLAGGVTMLGLIFWLTPQIGIRAVAIARLCYSLVTLLIYIPLIHELRHRQSIGFASSLTHATCEDL